MRSQTMNRTESVSTSKLRETLSSAFVYALIALTAALMVAGMAQRSRGQADCCASASVSAE